MHDHVKNRLWQSSRNFAQMVMYQISMAKTNISGYFDNTNLMPLEKENNISPWLQSPVITYLVTGYT